MHIYLQALGHMYNDFTTTFCAMARYTPVHLEHHSMIRGADAYAFLLFVARLQLCHELLVADQSHPQCRLAQTSSLLLSSIPSLLSMPSDGTSIRLSLGVMKAKFLQKKDTIRKDVRKLRALRATIKNKEEELDGMEEERSSSFSSGSPLLASESEDEKEEVSQASSVKKEASGTPSPAGKQPLPAVASPPPPKSGAPKPSPTPVLNKEVVVTPKVSGKTSKEGPPKGKGVRERRPFISPGESAPDHRGKPNAQGELYPGFRQSDSRYCEACEQLRRGFKSATKAHRPKADVCAWAPMAGKA